jgi:hypothetical protein
VGSAKGLKVHRELRLALPTIEFTVQHYSRTPICIAQFTMWDNGSAMARFNINSELPLELPNHNGGKRAVQKGRRGYLPISFPHKTKVNQNKQQTNNKQTVLLTSNNYMKTASLVLTTLLLCSASVSSLSLRAGKEHSLTKDLVSFNHLAFVLLSYPYLVIPCHVQPFAGVTRVLNCW